MGDGGVMGPRSNTIDARSASGGGDARAGEGGGVRMIAGGWG